MRSSDADLAVRDDGIGRRGEVDRRSFIRMGVIGTAMGSAVLMGRDREAGAAALARSVSTVRPRGAGLVAAGAELGLPAGFSYHTFGGSDRR